MKDWICAARSGSGVAFFVEIGIGWSAATAEVRTLFDVATPVGSRAGKASPGCDAAKFSLLVQLICQNTYQHNIFAR